MQSIAAAHAELVAALRAAGLVVADDPAAVVPPCTIVDAPRITRVGVTWRLAFPVLVVARAPVTGAGLVELLDRVEAVLTVDPRGEANPGPIGDLYGELDLPGYRVDVTRTIPAPCPTP